MRLNSRSQPVSINTSSSAPQVLLTETPHANRNQDTRTSRDTRTNTPRAQQQLISQLSQARLNSNSNMQATNLGLGSIPPGFGPQQGNNTFGHSVTNQGNTTLSPQQQALLTQAVYGSGNQSTPHRQRNFLLSVQHQDPTKPANANRNMDTGASSHLNSSATNLSNVFNSCIYPSVFVGDGKSIPVTNTGHSTLTTPHRTLHLNNVLITPNIVKNLIFVRQFVRDNKCTIKFDEFGFSVKEYWTRQILLRCDSTGDLYPVTAPKLPQAFLVNQDTWHQ
ncbi:hypothetical protein Tco_0398498 [Tanacetum coccineum]